MRNAEASLPEVPFKLLPEDEARIVLSSSSGLFLQYSGWRRAHSGHHKLRNHAGLSKFTTEALVIQRKAKNTDNCHVSIFNLELLPEMASNFANLKGFSL